MAALARRWRWGVLAGVLVGVAGCGYRLGGRAGTVAADVQRIAVPMFTNTTAVPGLDRLFTAAVRQEFLRDGRVRVVTEPGATVVLRGQVRRYELQVLATDSSDFAQEYRVETEVHITVEDRRQGGTILDQPVVTTTEYVESTRVVPSDIARDRALQVMVHDAGQRIVSLLLDRF